MMPVDPYAPPKTEPASTSEPSKKSFALRTSVVLAIVGVAVFWIPGTYVFIRQGEVSSGAEAVLGLGAIASISSHLVGVGVVFAAPPGKRLAGAIANAVPLLVLAALMTLGASVKV
jgi:hypothetical protein